MNRIKEIFQEKTGFRMLLLSVLITGLSYGLYKGMLDNYLAGVVQMGEMDRGVTEFFRVNYYLCANSVYKKSS